MPAKGISRRTDRDCLICGGQTRVAHLGIDVCRACSVFYRRAEKGNSYTCRTSSRRCPRGPGMNCKRCRYDHIDRLLKQSGAIPSTSTDQRADASDSPPDQRLESSPSTSASSPSRTEMPILERLRIHYRTMSRERLNSELHARPNPPHPLEISLERGPFFPATCNTLALSNRVLLTALLDFGSCVFPEIIELSNKEIWDLTVSFFYRFRLFEGIYRGGIVFPDDLDRIFGGFTTWFSPRNMDNFYSDAPTGDRAGAQEYVKHSSLRIHEIYAARELIQRANLCHEEFLVLIALMFWAFGDMPVREELTQIGEKYRESIMKELHAFYREQLRLDDYATRLGELMLLLPVFDVTMETLETLKNNARDCLICSESTTVAHLGMDVCRACAVFYRRYNTRITQFVCRDGGNCPTGRGLSCKRCRLDHIDRRMKECISAENITSMPTFSVMVPRLFESQEVPLLERLKAAYKTMSYARLSSEIYSRIDIPHPLRISLEEGPFFPGSLESMTLGIRILLSTSLNFGSDVFPEFAELREEDKWSIVVNFLYRFRHFENCHRSNLHFHDDPEKNFSSYAGWVTPELNKVIWKAHSPTGDSEGALKYLERRDMFKHLNDMRQAVARFDPGPEEFLTIMVLMFFDELNNVDAIINAGEYYRNSALKELQAFYRNTMKLDNYAARLGELMILLQVFDKQKDFKENFEALRLFNVVPEDNFIYALQKEGSELS